LVVKPVNFGFNLAELACQFPIISSDAPSPSAPSFGLELFEDLGNEWLAEVPPPAPRRPQRSPAIEDGPFITFDTREPLVLMASALGKFTAGVTFPEAYRGDLRTEWELQLGLSDPDPVVHLLKIFVWLSSNNMLGTSTNPRTSNFFDWIVDNLPSSVLDALLSAKFPTTEACIEHIFAHSLRRGNLGLLRTLLAKRRNLVQVLGFSKPVDTNSLRPPVVLTGSPDQVQTFRISETVDELFLFALRLNDVEITRCLLAAGDDAGRILPLWNAQSPKMVEMLSAAGADVNTLHLVPLKDIMHSLTALFWGICCGNTAVAQSLIQNKADVNIAAINLSPDRPDDETTYGITPLRAAIDRAVRGLKKLGDDEEHINDGLKLIRILLKAGANVNAPSLGEFDLWPLRFRLATPLQVASKAGHKSLSRLLLDSGADVNAPPYPEASTALLGAVESGDGELVKMLLHRGAVVDAPGRHESEPRVTCLLLAVERGDAAIVKLLLEAGADGNFPVMNHFGLSSIEITEAFTNNSEIMQLLLEFGAMPDREGQQRAQLIHAMSRRDPACVRSIINAGIVLTEPDGFRSRILREAIEWGDENILLVLIQAGIDVNKMFEANQEDFILQGRYGTHLQTRQVSSFFHLSGHFGTLLLLDMPYFMKGSAQIQG
jgi:ankyrin repeat protein